MYAGNNKIGKRGSHLVVIAKVENGRELDRDETVILGGKHEPDVRL